MMNEIAGSMIALAVAACSGGAASLVAQPLPTGTWGGDGARLIVHDDSRAEIELSCAGVRLDGPIVIDGGAFRAAGTYTRHTGAPPQSEDPEPALRSEPVQVSGKVAGRTITLTIQFITNETSLRVTLVQGAEGHVAVCG